MEKVNKLNQTYIPTELNSIFSKGTKHILKAFKTFISTKPDTFAILSDLSILNGQIEIILEKFSHDLLKTLVLTKAKFVEFPDIKRTIELSDSLKFFVNIMNDNIETDKNYFRRSI